MKILLVALNAQYMHTNLALRQIARAARGTADVALYEGHINLPFRHVLECIGRARPDAVGFSTYIWNADYVFRLCRALRQALPGVTLFAGGPEVAQIPEIILNRHGALDYVLSGEGEAVAPPFFAALSSGAAADVPGVSGRAAQGVFVHAPPPPLDAWDDAWADGGACGLEKRILYVETSRGCPFRCGYCLSASAGPVRALPAMESIRRLTRLADAGVELIKLVDRTFNFDKERACAIWRGLIAHSRATGLVPRYHFEIGAQLLDDAALAVLADAPEGLFQFEAGIQSTDSEVLSRVGRDISFAALRAPLERVRDLRTIHLHVDLIAGLPGEDMARFARSFDDVFSLGADNLQMGFLKMLEGSPLRLRAEELGIRFAPDPPYEVLSTPALSFLELCHLKDVEKALDWYANSQRYAGTLRYLLMYATPFALFGRIAAANRASGMFDAEAREKRRAQALLALFDCPQVRALMAHDLLTAGLRRELPDAVEEREDDALRALLREKFHPVRGQAARRYAYDVIAFAQGGALEARESVVLYGA